MIVKYPNNENLTVIETLACGTGFLAKSRNTGEIQLYMIIDNHSGIFINRSRTGNTYAVNLTTGQIRCFSSDTLVTPVNATVTYEKMS